MLNKPNAIDQLGLYASPAAKSWGLAATLFTKELDLQKN